MNNKQIEAELKKLNEKVDLLLTQKYGASEKPNDVLQPESLPVPVRKRQVKQKPIDLETFYRKKGIL
jgi:hypothetical protein